MKDLNLLLADFISGRINEAAFCTDKNMILRAERDKRGLTVLSLSASYAEYEIADRAEKLLKAAAESMLSADPAFTVSCIRDSITLLYRPKDEEFTNGTTDKMLSLFEEMLQ